MAVPGDPAAARDPARQRLTEHQPDGPVGRDQVDRELRRLTDRLVSLGPQRLGRLDADGVTPAARLRPLLQRLADVAADAEGRHRRPVPVLAHRALPDQLTVLVTDVLAADAPVTDVHGQMVAVRRAL